MIQFAHLNFNVLDMERSLAFYREALDLQVVRTVERPGFTLQYLGDGATGFSLELTQLHGRTEPYNLGENEFHLAFRTGEFRQLHKKHEAMGIICYENPGMGIYFISDPDGYWIEIVPQK